jgi:hypothetical protein
MKSSGILAILVFADRVRRRWRVIRSLLLLAAAWIASAISALRNLVLRLTLEDIERVAEADTVFPDGRPEGVVMWSALLILQGALAVAPRRC